MKLNKKIVSFAAVTVVAVASMGIIRAQAGPGFGPFSGHGHRARMGQFMADHLDLTVAQQAQAKALFEATRKANEPTAAQLKQVMEQAHNAVKAGKSEGELTAIANQTGPLVSQLAANHLKAMAKFYATLSQPQKDKVERLHDHVKARIEQHMQGASAHEIQ